MASTKEYILFQKEKTSFKSKFYVLMDLLISSQNSTYSEMFVFMGIFFFQTLSGFFDKNVGVLNPTDSSFDNILFHIERIIRLRGLFENSYSQFQAFLIIFFVFSILLGLGLLIAILMIKKDTSYSWFHATLNMSIKLFLYFLYNIFLDFSCTNFCFESDPKDNPHFPGVTCKFQDKVLMVVLSVLMFVLSNFLYFFLHCYYIDSFYLSNSPYSKISCGYDINIGINCLLFSILLSQIKYLSKEVFFIFNVISSFLLLRFYIKNCVYYNHFTHFIAGMFHSLYLWTSIFFFVFSFFTLSQIGIVYVLTSFVLVILYVNLQYKMAERILLSTPFYKIKNDYHVLYYLKLIIDKLNLIDKDQDEKALLTGIIHTHAVECPNPNCLTKTNQKIYLPIANLWSDRSTPFIKDKVFLQYFAITIMDYFVQQKNYSAEMIINESYYFLEILGNYCQALYYYSKIKDMKLNMQEKFTLFRLKLLISKTLVSKCKQANEPCLHLEEVNMTLYFKYSDLSQKFFEEISNDVNYSIEFWKNFRLNKSYSSKIIDYNNIFHLTDQIRITKAKVEGIWKELFSIYNGVNNLFELYLSYTEQINDDDLLKRDLEATKRKIENLTEYIQQNYYVTLFNKDTGIIICNGDKGSEGIIEKTNQEIEPIFKFKPEELKGMNISQLMPRLLAKDHRNYMNNYFEVGEKKIIDNKDIKSFGRDKDNSLLLLKLSIKLFPALNENVLFASMIIKENVDDIILIDSQFNIQGMSSKLMNIFEIKNKTLFMENEIPFYLICKKFVNFYRIFLHNKKKKKKVKKDLFCPMNTTDTTSMSMTTGSAFQFEAFKKNVIVEKEDDEFDDEDSKINIEINENIELEYEIKIPQFIYDFSAAQNKKDEKIEMKLLEKDGDKKEKKDVNININETFDEFGESDLLVEDDAILLTDEEVEEVKEKEKEKEKATTLKRAPLLTKESNLKNTIIKSQSKANITTKGEEKKKEEPERIGDPDDFNRQSEEEKAFLSKINKSKELFLSSKFYELENYIDETNKTSTMNDYKFNFTFDRYKFGKKQTAYIVRCIDNKGGMTASEDDSNGEENEQKLALVRKNKNESLKIKYELFYNEKLEILDKYENFLTLSIEDPEFKKRLYECKEEMILASTIHGNKKEEIAEDENASQSSKANYNADLCKKNHIEEIRANIMKNVSNFYTLKWIKLVALAVVVITVVFLLLYSLEIANIKKDLAEVSSLNSDLFQTTLWFSNLLSSLLSLRGQIDLKRQGDPYQINTFLGSQESYFNYLKNISETWYKQIITNFGNLEYSLGKYIKDQTIFWSDNPVTYPIPESSEINDFESFPLSTSQILSDVNSLLQNKYFTINSSVLDEMNPIDEELFSYLKFMAVENTYDNLLVNQFNKLKDIPGLLEDYNSNKMTIIYIVFFIYFFLIFVLNALYACLIYFTNKNMGEGLEKVSKIRSENIDEILKRIDTFNEILKRIWGKENTQLGNIKKWQEMDGAQYADQKALDEKPGDNKNAKPGFNIDNKQHKKLKILTFSYIQIVVLTAILCLYLIPIFLFAAKMISSTNKMINVQKYLLGKILSTSLKTVQIKCLISKCQVESELDFDFLINNTEIQSIVQGIAIFGGLSDYYNYKFLLNACDAVYEDSSSEEYLNCMQDSYVKSANNTDSFLKLIDDTVSNVQKAYDLLVSTSTESTYKLFSDNLFKEMELMFYLYIAPVSYNLVNISNDSLKTYLKNKLVFNYIICIILGASLLGIALWICLCFVNKLIHLLSVSRCILKIIPTSVIINTQELENWIENKY